MEYNPKIQPIFWNIIRKFSLFFGIQSEKLACFADKSVSRKANKSRVNLLSICFCLALALVSHSFRDKRKWQNAFTSDACSESRENNCFHATITGPSPENTLSKTQSRQGLLPALIFGLVGQMSVTSPLRLGWCRSCRRGGCKEGHPVQT